MYAHSLLTFLVEHIMKRVTLRIIISNFRFSSKIQFQRRSARFKNFNRNIQKIIKYI